MARPKKNNLDYFSHDNCMRNDRKIKALRAKFHLEGYAIFNMLLEILCESELLVIKWDEIEKELISGDLTIVSDKLTIVSEYLCSVNLLKLQNGYLFCPQLDKRSEGVFGKRIHDLDDLRKKNGINLTETLISDTEIPHTLTESTQSKVKKSKVKNIEERQQIFKNEIKEFISNKWSIEMLKNFYNYWSEPNKTKTKMRCELEKTWETKRRVQTWFNNQEKFNKQNFGNKKPDDNLKYPVFDKTYRTSEPKKINEILTKPQK